MLNIFDVICQIADDFYEKKNPHFSRILPLQVCQRLFIITLNNLQEAVFRQQSIFFFNRADKNKSTVRVLSLIFFSAMLYYMSNIKVPDNGHEKKLVRGETIH